MPPAKLDEQGTLALARRAHFPGVEEGVLKALGAAARKSPNPLQFLPRVGRFARALAAQLGATEITLDDVREAAALEGMELPELTLPRPGKRAGRP